MRTNRWGFVAVALLAGAACDRGPRVPEGAREEEEPAAPAAASQARAAGPVADDERDAVAGLFWRPPEGFERRRPSSPMRVAEYVLPGTGPHAAAELTVHHFPGMGGSLGANIDRWRGQFRTPEGQPPEVERETRQVGALEVTIVSMAGTYDPGPMPGSTPGGPNMKLLGAIVARPEGPVFFKLIGEAAAVDAAKPAFDAMIGTLLAR